MIGIFLIVIAIMTVFLTLLPQYSKIWAILSVLLLWGLWLVANIFQKGAKMTEQRINPERQMKKRIMKEKGFKTGKQYRKWLSEQKMQQKGYND